MTIEQKAKAYDEALELAKDYFKANQRLGELEENDILSDIFPELKESENERIRKWLIGYFHQYKEDGMEEYANGLKVESIIAWLEKQKTSDEALQYLKENHSPSEVSDFQAAMNIAVAKAYDKGYNDGLEKQGEQHSWSEEDEEFLRRAINVTKDAYPMTAKWLKSLRPQNRWKPSEEQMRALHDMNLTGDYSYVGQGQTLIELYNDLKKLREE